MKQLSSLPLLTLSCPCHPPHQQEFSFETFGHTDFKYVDGLPDSQMLKGLKVWPVAEIVTYGFNYEEAPLHTRGEIAPCRV
jgi:hypothetical protein